MREIKFRGRRVDNNNWAYGYYSRLQDDYYIGTPKDYICDHETGERDVTIDENQIIHETVGQYTGLKDKNDKEIFEEDTLRFAVFDRDDHDTHYTGLVIFSQGQWQLWKSKKDEHYGDVGAFDLYWVHHQYDEIEIVEAVN